MQPNKMSSNALRASEALLALMGICIIFNTLTIIFSRCNAKTKFNRSR